MGKKTTNQNVPAIGRIIIAVIQLPGTRGRVERPGIIVRTWPDEMTEEVSTAVQAQIFMDADGTESNDGTPPCLWRSSLPYDEKGEMADSWHWPKRD